MRVLPFFTALAPVSPFLSSLASMDISLNLLSRLSPALVLLMDGIYHVVLHAAVVPGPVRRVGRGSIQDSDQYFLKQLFKREQG